MKNFNSNNSENIFKYHVVAFVVLILTFLIYFPGLSGGYVFDDIANLKTISVFQRFDGVDAFIRYVLNNEAGPLKRPVSTLSFLLNSTTWPADPFWFKLTNLFIHILNGLLLYIVTLKFLRNFKLHEQSIAFVALVNMSLWVLNPFFVSTTLYIIQRMAMLPTTFILIGMYVFLLARENLAIKSSKVKWQLFISVYVCTALASLSKENGVILPILLLLMNYIISQQQGNRRLPKIYTKLFLILPSFLITIAFIYKMPDFIVNYNIRNFDLSERLLTEARVVTTYLFHLFVPQYLTESVFADGFQISHSLIDPLSTLFCIMFLVALIVFSTLQIRKKPLMSFAILFFLLSLIIESTVIPLEVYFEHRSYLPSLFIFLPIALLVNWLRLKRYKLFLVIIPIIGIFGFTTFLRTQLWVNNSKLILMTSDKYPNSIRAFTRKVSNIYTLGYVDLALDLLNKYTVKYKNLSLKFNTINLICSKRNVKEEEFKALFVGLEETNLVKDDRSSMIAIFNLLSKGNCVDDSIKYYRKIIELSKNNAGFDNPLIAQTLHYHDALVTLLENRFETSIDKFIHYLVKYEDIKSILFIIELFIEKKQYTFANILLGNTMELLKNSKFNYSRHDYRSQALEIKQRLDELLNKKE